VLSPHPNPKLLKAYPAINHHVLSISFPVPMCIRLGSLAFFPGMPPPAPIAPTLF
jgi:hypothetical protein